MNLFFYKALERIPQGITVALEFVGPLGLSLLLSRKWTDLLWATLAIAGVILLLPLEKTQAYLDPLGVAFALMAGLCWAFYIFFAQRVGSSLGTSAVAMGMCIACLVTFPLGLQKHGSSLFTFQVIPLALGIALLSSVIPYSLELSALKKIPAKTFGILMSLEPVVATLVAYLLAQEKVRASKKVITQSCSLQLHPLVQARAVGKRLS
ncbi:MAG: EamA family transporter [Bdellovibrionota bacterium]